MRTIPQQLGTVDVSDAAIGENADIEPIRLEVALGVSFAYFTPPCVRGMSLRMSRRFYECDLAGWRELEQA